MSDPYPKLLAPIVVSARATAVLDVQLTPRQLSYALADYSTHLEGDKFLAVSLPKGISAVFHPNNTNPSEFEKALKLVIDQIGQE